MSIEKGNKGNFVLLWYSKWNYVLLLESKRVIRVSMGYYEYPKG